MGNYVIPRGTNAAARYNIGFLDWLSVMQYKMKHVTGFTVSGLTVRTKNSDEFNPSTAKIAPLWRKLVEMKALEAIPDQPAKPAVYGVYSSFESGAEGEYDLTAGALVTKPGSEFSHIYVSDGDYLVFEARGDMPEALIQTWGAIWTYFEQHPEQQRCFKTDFEHYCGEQAVDVFIGIDAKKKQISFE